MKKYFYHTTVWRMLVQVSTFILNLLIARYFGASISGDLFYLLSIYSLIILFFSISLESGIIYYGTKQLISFPKLINVALVLTVVSSLFMLIYFLFFAAYKNMFSSTSLMLWAALSFVAGNLLYSFAGSLFYASKNFTYQYIICFIVQLLLIFLLVLKWQNLWPQFTDELYFQLYFYSFLLMGAVCFISFILKQRVKYRLVLPTKKEFVWLFNFCFLAWIGNLVFFLLYRIDYLFVEKWCSAEELGNYIQVSKIAQLFFIVPSILAAVIFPLTISQTSSVIIKWITLLSRFIFLGYSLICVVAALVGYWLFPFIFGATFTKMYQPFVLLIPGILSLTISFTLTAYNAGIRKLKHNIKAAFIALVVVILGNLVSIPFYSIQIAATVSSFGYLALMIYLIIDFKKNHSLRLADFFIFKKQDYQSIKNSIFKNNKL